MEAMRDWFNDFCDVTYCNAPWVNERLAEPSVHHSGLPYASPSSPRFEILRRQYLASTLPAHLVRFAAFLRKGRRPAFFNVRLLQAGPQSLVSSTQPNHEPAHCLSLCLSLSHVGCSEDHKNSRPYRFAPCILDMTPPGGTGWIAGTSTPTYADIVLAEYLDQHVLFAPSFFSHATPTASASCAPSSASTTTQPSHISDADLAALDDLRRRVLALPAIQAYRSSEAFKEQPLHQVFSHFHLLSHSSEPCGKPSNFIDKK